jgi:hypothetical protein
MVSSDLPSSRSLFWLEDVGILEISGDGVVVGTTEFIRKDIVDTVSSVRS